MSDGILDTCVVISIDTLDPAQLPDGQAITTITLGELSAGPLIATDPAEQARRQGRLQAVEREFAASVLPYDIAAARAFGTVMAEAFRGGRRSRARVSDYQIAAIAIAHGLPLYTVNVDDFDSITGLDLRRVDPHSDVD